MKRTTSELNIVIDALKDHMNEKFNDISSDLSDIKSQVKSTNGRVKALEIWRSFLLGGMAVVTAIVVPLIVYIWMQQTSIGTTISTSIKAALSEYEVEVIP